jgi:putative hydrolase of the HAD superfamily
MIKTVIFDFDHVLIHGMSQDRKYLKRLEKTSKADLKKLKTAIKQSELGKISYHDLCQVTKKAAFPEKTVSEIEQFFIRTKILPPWNIAKKLSKKYQIIIFSNHHTGVPEKIGRYLKTNFHQFPFLNSAYIGLCKPNVSYYRHLLKTFDINPKEAIFIDDRKVNLETAKKLKIKTFHYRQNSRTLLKYLRKNGVQT